MLKYWKGLILVLKFLNLKIFGYWNIYKLNKLFVLYMLILLYWIIKEFYD